MMKPDEIIEVVQAFKDGKDIQGRNLGVGASRKWYEIGSGSSPCWNFESTEYRVKPAEPREFWVHTTDMLDFEPQDLEDYIRVRELLNEE